MGFHLHTLVVCVTMGRNCKWLCLSLVYAAAIIGLSCPGFVGSKYLLVELEDSPKVDNQCGLKYFRQIKNGSGGTWQEGGVQPGCSEAVEGQEVLTDLGVPPDVRAKGYLRRVYEGP